MLGKFSALFAAAVSTLCSSPIEFPEILDFKKDAWDSQLVQVGYFYDRELGAFNNAPELCTFFEFLRKEYQIDTVIETGTARGTTTHFFSRCFGDVHTIDIDEKFYNHAKAMFIDRPKVHCHLGSSEKVLKEILPSFKDRPVVFYLDAHWYDYLPLFDELNEIAKTHKDNCVIVIDDFKVPNRSEFAYYSQTKNGKQIECSYEFIKENLDRAFTEYTIHYLLPKDPFCCAKFVAIPKKLARKL